MQTICTCKGLGKNVQKVYNILTCCSCVVPSTSIVKCTWWRTSWESASTTLTTAVWASTTCSSDSCSTTTTSSCSVIAATASSPTPGQFGTLSNTNIVSYLSYNHQLLIYNSDLFVCHLCWLGSPCNEQSGSFLCTVLWLSSVSWGRLTPWRTGHKGYNDMAAHLWEKRRQEDIRWNMYVLNHETSLGVPTVPVWRRLWRTREPFVWKEVPHKSHEKFFWSLWVFKCVLKMLIC